MLLEKDEKIKELKNQLSINEKGSLSSDNKLNSMQNIVSEIISKNKKCDKIIKGLNEEIVFLKSDRITDLNINNTTIHKLYVKDNEEAWALVSKKIDMKLNELLNDYNEDLNWVKLTSINKIENYNFSK